MKIGIMQPYFFPYIGYWQLINAVDKFVIYDNIQFTKRGWIRRNRILMNGEDKMISLPIKKDSDYLDVNKRYLSDTFNKDKSKIISQIKTAYSKAPEFDKVFPLIESAINCKVIILLKSMVKCCEMFILNWQATSSCSLQF